MSLSLQDYEDLLARIQGLPGMIDQIIILLREGMKQGVTYAKESMGGVNTQFQQLQVPVRYWVNFMKTVCF